MNRYEILCTEAQTKKALKLGAPIEEVIQRLLALNAYMDGEYSISEYRNKGIAIIVYKDDVSISAKGYRIPTVEQMISWLEEKIYNIVVVKNKNGTWFYMIYWENSLNHEIKSDYTTRKEATLAAIDAALEYLENLNR